MSIKTSGVHFSGFKRFQGLAGALVASIGVFWIYWFTLAPTIQGFDSAELTVGAMDLGFVHPTGYPLYMLVGNLFADLPIRNIAFRLNLMSAIFGSLTILVLYVLVYQQTRRLFISMALVVLFALTPVYWSQAIRAEVYTLHTFLIVVTLYCWFTAHQTQRIGWYLGCFIFLGLGLANHVTTIWIWISIIIVSFSLSTRWKSFTLWASLVGLVLAGILYLYFPIRSFSDLRIDYIQPYFGIDFRNLSSLIWLVSGRAFHCFMSFPLQSTQLWINFQRLGSFLLSGSLGIGIILSILGWNHLRRTDPLWNRLLSIYLLANIFMFLVYQVIDKEVMIIPVLIILCLWSVHGVEVFISSLSSRVKLHTTNGLYAVMSLILFIMVFLAATLDWGEISLRNETRFYTFSSRILQTVPPNTLIISHWATASVFDYLKLAEGKRWDVDSFNLDFYFLAGEASCSSAEEEDLGPWYAWLSDQLARRPLCFIEPLPPVPNNMNWQKQNECWTITLLEE